MKGAGVLGGWGAAAMGEVVELTSMSPETSGAEEPVFIAAAFPPAWEEDSSGGKRRLPGWRAIGPVDSIKVVIGFT